MDKKSLGEKKVEMQYVKKFYRKLGVMFANKLVSTKITPNQITIFGIFMGISAGFLFSQGDYLYSVLGAITLQISLISDYIDGSLARMRSESSKLGDWLDATSCRIVAVVVFFGIIWGLYTIEKDIMVWILGLTVTSTFLLIEDMYIRFQTYSFANRAIQHGKKRFGPLKELLYTPAVVYPLIFFGALLDMMLIAMYILAIYGLIGFLGLFMLQTRIIMKQDV